MMLFLVTNGAVSPLVCCKLSFVGSWYVSDVELSHL